MTVIQVRDIYLTSLGDEGWSVGDGTKSIGNGLATPHATSFDLVIPQNHKEKPVLVIDDRAFQEVPLKSLKLPDSIRQIQTAHLMAVD